MYLDFDALYNECQGQIFVSGKKKYYDDAVSGITTTAEDGRLCIKGRVGGEKIHSTSITFDETGELYDYSCDCERFSISGGPCKHIVALALSFEEKNPNSDKPQKQARNTDASVLTLISDYNRKRKRKLVSDEDVRVELTPYVSFESGVSLRFSIGRKKQYNLKDISDFVSAYKNNAYRRYGVDLELYHTPNNFTEESKKLIDFLCSVYKEKQDFGINPLKYRDEISLMAGDVDELFSMLEGKFIPIDKQNMYFVCQFSDVLPIKVIIKQVEEGFEISLSHTDFKIIDGKLYNYVVLSEKIYRVSKDLTDTLKEFFDTVSIKKTLFVGEKDMTLFYNSVVVTLAHHLEIDANGVDLSIYEADPLSCKVYIDATPTGIALSLESCYDDNKLDILNENINTDYVRDWDTENSIRDILSRYFPFYPDLTLDDEGEIFDFLTVGVKELYSYAEVFVLDSMKKLRIRSTPRIHVGVKYSSSLLELDFNAEGYTKEEIEKIIGAYREHKRYVRLGEGFVDLNDASVSALSGVLEFATPTKNGYSLPSYYAPYVNDELKHGFFYLDRDSSFKNLISGLESTENADIECPPALANVLRNYQKTGYRWLKTLNDNNFGGILADDMGLGKSLQVIALLLDKPSKAIIVCPTTLMLNWQSEIKKFAPSLKVLVVMGSMEERNTMIATADDYDVVVTSYDLIRRDVELYGAFDYAIADEAQFIKNPDTKNAISVKRLNATHRFALTGTPIENHLGELWSIFDFIMPRFLGTYAEFRDKYEIGAVLHKDESVEKLKRIVRPFILRRLKSEVLTELPPKIESSFPAVLEGEQKRLYDANLALVKSAVSVKGYNRVSVLAMLTKLRQICCDPSLVYPAYVGNSAKLDSCLELIRTAIEGGHKILLFSQFTSMLDVLRKKLMAESISFYMLKGNTPKAERLRLVNKFNSDDTKVFLISLKAGGTGLNLTGADVVIHYDPWWNESVMNQATDRAYRMGQERSVQVYKLILENTLEEKIIELQEEKSALSSLVVGKENDLKQIIALLKE